jgi:hypothetical protein
MNRKTMPLGFRPEAQAAGFRKVMLDNKLAHDKDSFARRRPLPSRDEHVG